MRILLITLLFLVLVPGVVSSAKDPTFSEHVTEMVREHRVLVDRLMAYWEFQHEEINLLAEVIYHENWHTDKEKRAAYLTGAVVMNRVNSPLWPNTVKAVLHQKGQYSTVKYFYTKEIPAECYDMARDIYKNGTPDVPADVIFQSMNPNLGKKRYETINGEYFAHGRA